MRPIKTVVGISFIFVKLKSLFDVVASIIGFPQSSRPEFSVDTTPERSLSAFCKTLNKILFKEDINQVGGEWATMDPFNGSN